MQNVKWVHIPFHRGQVMLSEKGVALSLPLQDDTTYSAWAMVISNDQFHLDGRVAGIVIMEESTRTHDLRLHLGWLEHSAQTRGKRSRMVADMIAFAWARWIDAQHLFLVGTHGDGVALTRDMTDEGDDRLRKWTRSRMRSSYRANLAATSVCMPAKTTGTARGEGRAARYPDGQRAIA
jgi:hypothetical protein